MKFLYKIKWGFVFEQVLTGSLAVLFLFATMLTAYSYGLQNHYSFEDVADTLAVFILLEYALFISSRAAANAVQKGAPDDQ